MEKISDDAATLLKLTCEKKLKGVREIEAKIVLPLDHDEIMGLAQKLEGEGKLRILSFSPLFVVSRESVDFLGRKILHYLSEFHKKNPKEKGVTLDRLKKRFDAPTKVLFLALKALVHEKRLKQDGRVFLLANFERQLPPREERLLRQLEEICFGGDLHTVSLKDIQERFHVTPQKLQSMLDILIERKKVVRSTEDFFIHARRLDEIIGKVRGLGKKELTVADFKAMTGLSRKYAIPLLELLDEMGVTRRTGPGREIL